MPRFRILYLTSGDSYEGTRRLAVTVTDEAEALVDLSGLDITFLVKTADSDADVDALITKTTADVAEIEIAAPQSGATLGVCYIALDEADTEDLRGRYVWEIEAVDAIGTITLGKGSVYIAGDIVGVAS